MRYKKIRNITEGKISKGGQNPSNTSTIRPLAPKGSGGKTVIKRNETYDNQEIMAKIAEIREYQVGLTNNERLALWYEISRGYCRYCGGSTLPCYCWMDE